VNVAERQHVDLIELGKKMPRGPKYFFDAAHFTSAGEHAASDIIYEDLTGNPLLTERLGSK
jgi:hypothetical protein